MYTNTWLEGIKKTKPVCSAKWKDKGQWTQVKIQEIHLNIKTPIFLLCAMPSIRRDFLWILWSFHLWKY